MIDLVSNSGTSDTMAGLQVNGSAVVGFTLGTFDLFHRGHVHHLTEVAARSDKMIVGLHTDNFVRTSTTCFPHITTSFRKYSE